MQLKISPNKLAEFITAKNHERRLSIVRALVRQKKTDKGYAPYYSSFGKPARTFLASGATNARPLTQGIARMDERRGKKWLNTDSRITAEAFKALLAMAAPIAAIPVEFVRPSSKLKAKLHFADSDVIVTVTPDMLVHGTRKGAPLIGALRFYIAKESRYELGRAGAEMVAVMQHLWLSKNATGERAPDSELCLVLECFQGRITAGPADVAKHVAAIEQGCRDFAAMWRSLTEKDAA